MIMTLMNKVVRHILFICVVINQLGNIWILILFVYRVYNQDVFRVVLFPWRLSNENKETLVVYKYIFLK